MSKRTNQRRIRILVMAQTLWHLEDLARICGYKELGRVVDKLTREKMLSLHAGERRQV